MLVAKCSYIIYYIANLSQKSGSLECFKLAFVISPESVLPTI